MSSNLKENKIKRELKDFFQAFKKCYFIERDLESLKKIFADDFVNIGSGSDEFAKTYNDSLSIFERDRQQCPNSLEYRFHYENIVPLSEKSGLIISELDIFTVIENTPISMPGYRFTIICEKHDDGWKIKHTHISKGEHKLEEGESFPLKDVEERNKLLKQIVQERTKELEEVNEELKEANRDILETKQRFESVFENVSDGIIVADWPSKKFFMTNHQICELLGYTKTEFESLWISDLIPKDHWKTAKKQFDEQQLGEKQLAEDIPLLTKDNKVRYFDINSKMIKINNKSYYVGLFRDITEKKKSIELHKEMEIAKKAAEAKDFFLANISHEIRTPVTGIIGMSEILSQTNLNQEQTEYLSIINDSSKILLDLINDILDISKIEAGKMSLNPSFFNIKDMLSNLVSLLEPSAKKQNIDFGLTYKTHIPDKIKADKKRIEQIIMNFVFNALKYTEKGSIKILVSGNKLDYNHFEIKIEVKDTGIGVSPTDQSKIFDKFFQLDSSLSRVNSGAGLGLFICKELVKLMGGNLGVESAPNEGSNFWFTFKSEIKPGKSVDKNLSYQDKSKKSVELNILVVDDTYVNRRVISLMLEKFGCKVDMATNGEEALQMFDPYKHHAIFMDIMMPVMDGIEALKKLKEKYKDLPPILALTANAMEGDDKKYLDYGFNSYLAKPVTLEDLSKKFQELNLM